MWTTDGWKMQMHQIRDHGNLTVIEKNMLTKIYSGIMFNGTDWIEEKTGIIPNELPWCSNNPSGKIISILTFQVILYFILVKDGMVVNTAGKWETSKTTNTKHTFICIKKCNDCKR